ncbi:hypothetical protein K435DRAFT_781695 [Dendrothele bispora CBS 962.96]|uniref:Uncharacterized protein n=1 Tax=Dendrothele bispora (strain CBS 962.96) TaxID=1314807 RepID=A0A4S8LJH4_DENBC|nr:hypothetical protein K435DRAFT_781695 [Dendrothele bispora CBS 962.96]
MNTSKNNSLSNVTNGLLRDSELNVSQSGSASSLLVGEGTSPEDSSTSARRTDKEPIPDGHNTIFSRGFDTNGNRDEVVAGHCHEPDTENENVSVPTTANLQNSSTGSLDIAQLNTVDDSPTARPGEAAQQPQRTSPLVGDGSHLRFDDALVPEHDYSLLFSVPGKAIDTNEMAAGAYVPEKFYTKQEIDWLSTTTKLQSFLIQVDDYVVPSDQWPEQIGEKKMCAYFDPSAECVLKHEEVLEGLHNTGWASVKSLVFHEYGQTPHGCTAYAYLGAFSVRKDFETLSMDEWEFVEVQMKAHLWERFAELKGLITCEEMQEFYKLVHCFVMDPLDDDVQLDVQGILEEEQKKGAEEEAQQEESNSHHHSSQASPLQVASDVLPPAGSGDTPNDSSSPGSGVTEETHRTRCNWQKSHSAPAVPESATVTCENDWSEASMDDTQAVFNHKRSHDQPPRVRSRKMTGAGLLHH